MVDSVIAGTGNSRYLRTSLSASTTWEDALTMLRAGTFPIDLAGINLAGFTTLGTALNSATLLKSAVITALGLDEDATPSDAWDAVIALISEKADADSTVTSVAYNSSTHKLTVTIDGVTTDVVTITPPPVNSVNTKTGDVVLGSGDIAYSDSATYPSGSVGAEVADLKSAISGGGLTPAIKVALLQLAEKVAYIDGQGQDYYQDLYDALYPPAELVSISAVFTQGQTVVYDTDSLDSLKPMLVVTATYSDSSTQTVPSTDYTLSGTLTVGTSTITVSYEGHTDTFTVTVSAVPLPTGYTAYDFVKLENQGYGLTIHTDIPMSTDYELETEILYTSTTTSNAVNIFGIRTGSSGRKQFGLFVTPSTGKLGYWVDNTDTTISNTPFIANSLNTVKYQPIGKSATYPNNNTFNINGTDYNTGNASTNVTYSPWLGFFQYGISADGSNTGYNADIGLHIGRTKIKNASGILLHDLQPVSDGTNNGLYDWVTQTLYLCNDSTKFLCGNWT